MTGRELTPMETFTERVKGKLRDDIGNMLPDEVVAEMVAKVINEEFFTKTQVNKGDQYRPRYEDVPTPFQRMVLEAAKDIIERHVLRVMTENAAQIEAQIAETVQDGLMKLAISTMDNMLGKIIQSRAFDIQMAIENEMRSKGMLR